MPLLMVEPEPGPVPPIWDVVVPAGAARIVRVVRGQLLCVETTDGDQVAELFAWTAADLDEWLSPHHTRVFGGTFVLRLGTRMVTNWRRPMFVVGRDTLRRHDLLMPASPAAMAAVADALAAASTDVPHIPDPVNLWLQAPLSPDGHIDVCPPTARPGERWTVRVLIDAIVAVAACPTGLAEADVTPPRDVVIRVRNDVRELPEDLPVAT